MTVFVLLETLYSEGSEIKGIYDSEEKAIREMDKHSIDIVSSQPELKLSEVQQMFNIEEWRVE